MFGVTKGPTGVFKSVLDTARTDGRRKDEIYVDVVERLTATFSASGALVSGQIDGSIQVRKGRQRGTRHRRINMLHIQWVMCGLSAWPWSGPL